MSAGLLGTSKILPKSGKSVPLQAYNQVFFIEKANFILFFLPIPYIVFVNCVCLACLLFSSAMGGFDD